MPVFTCLWFCTWVFILCLFWHHVRASFAKGTWVQKNAHYSVVFACSMDGVVLVACSLFFRSLVGFWYLWSLHYGLSCTEPQWQCFSVFSRDCMCCGGRTCWCKPPGMNIGMNRSRTSWGRKREGEWGAALCLPGGDLYKVLFWHK